MRRAFRPCWRGGWAITNGFSWANSWDPDSACQFTVNGYLNRRNIPQRCYRICQHFYFGKGGLSKLIRLEGTDAEQCQRIVRDENPIILVDGTPYLVALPITNEVGLEIEADPERKASIERAKQDIQPGRRCG